MEWIPAKATRRTFESQASRAHTALRSSCECGLLRWRCAASSACTQRVACRLGMARHSPSIACNTHDPHAVETRESVSQSVQLPPTENLTDYDHWKDEHDQGKGWDITYYILCLPCRHSRQPSTPSGRSRAWQECVSPCCVRCEPTQSVCGLLVSRAIESTSGRDVPA
jgi:hypothetical protein